MQLNLTTHLPSSSGINNISISSNDIQTVSYEDYFDPRLPKWVSLVLFFVGIFGNLLSVWVFSQRQMRKNSTFVYLAFLCFVDLYVLCFGLGDLILISHFGIVLRNKSLLVCRLHTFLTYTFTHLSSFILASVSIDRAIATNLINFAKSYCKPRVAHRVILINCALAILLNAHTLGYMGYMQRVDNNKTSYHITCDAEKDSLYDYFINPYFQWLDLIFYAILPFITMAICSFFIIRVMFASNKRLKKTLTRNTAHLVSTIKANFEQQQLNNNGASRESTDLLEIDRRKSLLGRIGRRSTTYLIELRRPSSGAPLAGANNRLNKTLHLTYTLISINALFFCLVSPLVIFNIFVKDVKESKLLFNIVYLLAYSNHSFNFVFYGLSSPPYRECIFDLCGRKAAGVNNNSNMNGHRRASSVMNGAVTTTSNQNNNSMRLTSSRNGGATLIH